MFRDFAEDITFLLLKNKIVDIGKRDIYVYGLEVIIMNAHLLMILFTISFLAGSLQHFFAFLVFFIPLRIAAGGYHAKSEGGCLLLSTVAYAISLMAVQLMPLAYKSWQAIAASIVLAGILYLRTPLVDINNELGELQVRRNRYAVRVLLIVDFALFILCYQYDNAIASSEMACIWMVCILFLVGKIKKNYLGREAKRA